MKKQKSENGFNYVLYESYKDQDCWKHKKLMDFGVDPGKFIEYPGGNSFYFDEVVEETLKKNGAKYSDEELEEIFIPFLDPDIRRIIEKFQRPDHRPGKWEDRSSDELMKYHKALHQFDKRRFHYLRFGRVDIGNIDTKPWKFFNILLEKSRDEIETMMEEMERNLSPHELRPYLYTALNLQVHFRNLFFRHKPASLNSEEVDRYFYEDLCRLNQDDLFFWGIGKPEPDLLHPYLERYLIMYFDSDFYTESIWDDYVEDFKGRHRHYRPPSRKKGLKIEEQDAFVCLGITSEEFKKMSRLDLTRCYRLKAKETHPDVGGNEETFLKIKDAYDFLIMKKQ